MQDINDNNLAVNTPLNRPSSSVVERRTENPEVSGSKPLSGISIKFRKADLTVVTAQPRYLPDKDVNYPVN